MANPTPSEVNEKTARRRYDAVPVEPETVPEPEPDPEPKPEKAEPAQRYRVLKAITHADGHTSMPGDDVTLDPAEWPARRARQLVDQKFLRPID